MELSIPEMAAFVVMLLNLAGLIWGASTLHSTVKTIKNEVLPAIQHAIDTLAVTVATHETRLQLIEAGFGRRKDDK